MTSSSPTRARLLLWVGALAISTAAPLFKAASHVDPWVASALRLALASLVQSLLVAWLDPTSRPATSRRAWGARLLGGLFYAIHFGAWVASLGLTSTAASVTLVTTTPIVLVVFESLRARRRPPTMPLAGVMLTTLGASVIAYAALGGDALVGGRRDALGLAYAAIGALAMAPYLVLARRVTHDPELGGSALRFARDSAATGAVWLAIAIAAHGASMGEAPTLAAPLELVWVALAALIPQTIGHTALTLAVRDVPASTVALATTAEPVFATLLSLVLLGEAVDATTALGCAITIAGVLAGTTLPPRADDAPAV